MVSSLKFQLSDLKGWSQASLAGRIQVRTYRNIFLEFGIKIEKS